MDSGASSSQVSPTGFAGHHPDMAARPFKAFPKKSAPPLPVSAKPAFKCFGALPPKAPPVGLRAGGDGRRRDDTSFSQS